MHYSFPNSDLRIPISLGRDERVNHAHPVGLGVPPRSVCNWRDERVLSIDGSFGEGGGQVLRSSLALSLVTGQPFHIENIRAGRRKPGLMAQHLASVRAARVARPQPLASWSHELARPVRRLRQERTES